MARRVVRFAERLSGGRLGHAKLALHPWGSTEPAAVVAGDALQPGSLKPTGETVNLHRHPCFASECKVTPEGLSGEELAGMSSPAQVDAMVEDNISILSPIEPHIFLGTGLNYHRHAEECGLPAPAVPILAFCKPSTSLQHPGRPIEIPKCCDPSVPEVDWEVELAVVIGTHNKTNGLCKDATLENALDYVVGYTVANDVSARMWQTDPERTGGQWNRGKSFDTFAPLGPALLLQEEGFDPHADLNVLLGVNGNTMQSSHTGDMIHQVSSIVEFLSRDTTLLPGTVILTGTPEGIGMFQDPPMYLQDGDVVAATIGGIGTLVNPVASANGN